ncbi:MAG: hypothetical protein ACI8QZ_004141 [Chlamydiales bacterium]|jgi:hypothetical protein
MAKTKKRDPHPADELRALEASLAQGTLARAYVFRGEERYFRERAAAAVVRTAAAAELEICKHDAVDPDFDLSRLLDDLVAGSLFAAARCVVIQRADSLLKKGARKFAPGLIAAIQARLTSDSAGCVVITADALRVDSVIVKAVLAAEGGNIACRRLWDSPPPWAPDPRRAELVVWVLARARELDVALQPDEAVYVAAATGNDLYALEGQLERLRTRGEAGIIELVGWQAGGSPYAVAEALVTGDAKCAVAGIEALFQAGFQGRDGARTIDRNAILALLSGALTGKLREAIAGARALESGANIEAALTAAGVRGGPKARDEFKARVGVRPSAQWLGLADEVAEIERRSRTGAKVDAADFAKLALRWAAKQRGR